MDTKMFTTLTFSEAEPGVGLVTMNRPERLNAINPAMVQDFETLFAALAQDETIRVLILTGAGRGFCSGADLSDATDYRQTEVFADPESYLRLGQERYGRLVLGLRAIPQPVIAAVNGPAAGAGFLPGARLRCPVRLARGLFHRLVHQHRPLRRGAGNDLPPSPPRRPLPGVGDPLHGPEGPCRGGGADRPGQPDRSRRRP